MQFKVNDKIEVIDDAVKGRIVFIDGDTISILTEEGFEMEVCSNEIVKTGAPSILTISNAEVLQILKEKGDVIKEKKHKKTTKGQHTLPMEVDLHIHELTGSTRGMTNYDMLNLQTETARRKLESAMKKRIQKVVFIHGVGAGVLKAELEALFKTYENITYYDADFKKYGSGATEVRIYQN